MEINQSQSGSVPLIKYSMRSVACQNQFMFVLDIVSKSDVEISV